MDLGVKRSFIFHPAVIITISFVGTGLSAVYATLRFSGDKLSNAYFYVTPIVIPFTAFLFDRAKRVKEFGIVSIVIDLLVVGTALWRVIGDVPFVSGHALFLSYAILSSCSRIVLITCFLVLIEVIYLKYFVWHDWITLTVGMGLGTLAGILSRSLRPRNV